MESKLLTDIVLLVITGGPTTWRLKRCDEGGRRLGALAREAVKCERGAPSPRSTPSNSSPRAILVFSLPLLDPISPTRRFKFDGIGCPLILFLSALLPPTPGEVDVAEGAPVDMVFLVVSATKVIQ